MTQTDTKTRILDCAEQMFARAGFHSTSLRKLTQLADANLASVNYHFGSKEALLQAVIERRLLPLNKIRHKKIEEIITQAREQERPPAAADLLQAFVVPTLEFRNSSPGAQDFIALIGRSLSEPDETVRHCFLSLALPIFQFLFEGLRQALPQIPAAILLARLQFIMGTMSHVMCMGNLNAFQKPDFPEALEQNVLMDQMLKFIQAGLEAPL
ncbi:MAG: TetR family transcriptional regulator [Deltaproteobacteria bacterium]|jgi:AcrR family transcriptional regulator|nr:TetR family transcriptional regulator [Deltaproteobacteria bacterium]MCW8892588.1 TetR family transcriptional regulator [Deltaproteobacteria bacterium]